MRRDLVAEVLDAASEDLFEDVVYTPFAGAPATVEKSIFGVEIATEQFGISRQSLRAATHIARALKAKFPSLARGDTIDDGSGVYQVLCWQVPEGGDGRFEIEMSLKKQS